MKAGFYLGAAAMALAGSQAQALDLATAAAANKGLEYLSTYNVIVTDTLTSGSHVDGRTFVGGNLQINNAFEGNSKGPAQGIGGTALPAIAVVGTVTGLNGNGGTLKIQNGGGLDVGGTVAGDVRLEPNGPNQQMDIGTGTATVQNLNQNVLNANVAGLASSLATQKGDIVTSLTALSQALAGLDGQKSISTVLGNNNTYNFTASGTQPTVYTLTNLSEFNGRQIEINDSAGSLLVINVTGGGAQTFASGVNFNGSSSSQSVQTIWNFINATTVNTTSQTFGSILALNANGVQGGSNITGATVLKSFAQNAEVHTYSGVTAFRTPYQFVGTPTGTGVVPEPATWAQMMLGFGVVGFAMRRRRRPAATAA